MQVRTDNIFPWHQADSLAVKVVTEPLTWIAAGLFFNISGITDYSASLASIESAIFLAGSITAFVRLWFGTRMDFVPGVGLAGFAVLSVSLLTSLLNGQDLGILYDYGWKHFFKFLFLMTLGLMVYPDGSARKNLHPTIYGALAVLAISVLIRFHVFREFNPETGRMDLTGRHGDPNFACLFMTMGASYALYYISAARSQAVRIAHAGVGLLFLVTAWFTESRAGLAVLGMTFMAGIFLFPLGHPRKNLLIGVSIGGLAALFLAGTRIIERYLSISDASNSGRIAGILATKDMLLEQPLWGSGFDSSSQFVRQYQDVLFASDTIALEIHTTPLQIAGELGIAGLLAYGLIYGWIAWLLVAKFFRTRTIDANDALAGLLTFAILANMISIPMTYIGTVHGIALVLLYGLLTTKKT